MRLLYSPAAVVFFLGIVVAVVPDLAFVGVLGLLNVFSFFMSIGFAAFLVRCRRTRQWKWTILIHALLAMTSGVVIPWLPLFLRMYLFGLS